MARIVLTIAAMAQLFGVVAGPLDHWRQSSRLGAHFEETGSSLGHYVHDEARCIACAMTGVAAAPPRRDAVVPSRPRARVMPRTETSVPSVAVLRTQSAPRAPPVFTGVSGNVG